MITAKQAAEMNDSITKLESQIEKMIKRLAELELEVYHLKKDA